MLFDGKPLRLLSLETIMQEPLPPTDWLVESLIAKGDRVVLYGMYGSKKSWILLHLALCLATGSPWLGHFAIPQSRRVLYIDEEMNQRTLRRRIIRLAQGLSLESSELPFHVLSRAGVSFTPDGAGQLLRALDDSKCDPEVVIVETLRRVLVGSENEAADIGRFWRHVEPILRAGKTLILSHHMRKPNPHGNDQNLYRASGSTDIIAGADTAFAVDKRPPDLIQIECVKAREVEEADPFVVSLYDEDHEGPVEMRYEGLSRDHHAGDLNELARTKQAITQFLTGEADHTAAKHAIVQHLESEKIALRTAERALKEMVKEGCLTKPRQGVYALVTPERRLHAV